MVKFTMTLTHTHTHTNTYEIDSQDINIAFYLQTETIWDILYTRFKTTQKKTSKKNIPRLINNNLPF